MSGKPLTKRPTLLDDASRIFVRRALAAGLVELDDVKKVVASLLANSSVFTPERIATGLQGADLLTTWQAQKLLAGKSRGFYLGSYRLLRPLGKGGMGVVYLGEHHVMKRLMALKILPPEAVQDARRIERFKEEARASAQLDHPNIVRAIDFSEASGKMFIVMEFVDGIDLHCAVGRDGVMSVPVALDVMIQATEGLAHAHERGIIHRDIKPSNLLLRTDGVVKVSDLGLARIGWAGADDPLRKNRLMGTADFVAPEQALNSQTVDARADIYSLGCTLYFLLTGKPPFIGDTVAQRLAKHQTEPTPDLRRLCPDCPAAVAELAMRMMAKRPEDRPKSAVELLHRLQRVASALGGKPHSGLIDIASAGEGVMDPSFYQATIDDSSLSSDGEVPIAAMDIEDLDFSNLPASNFTSAPVMSPLATAPMMRASGASANGAARGAAAGTTRTGHRLTAGLAEGQGQNMLLGIGLAVATMALIATISVAAYTVMHPPEMAPQKIKAIEEGKDGRIIVVR